MVEKNGGHSNGRSDLYNPTTPKKTRQIFLFRPGSSSEIIEVVVIPATGEEFALFINKITQVITQQEKKSNGSTPPPLTPENIRAAVESMRLGKLTAMFPKNELELAVLADMTVKQWRSLGPTPEEESKLAVSNPLPQPVHP